jgi:hypothetical protein
MIANPHLSGPATALYLNLSCLPDAKEIIGSSQAVSFLVDHLYNNDANDTKGSSCKHDALYTLYNLSNHQASVPALLSAGTVDALHCLLTELPASEGLGWTEKALAVVISLATTQAGRKEIMSTPGLVTSLATLLGTGEPTEQEQVVSCLLVMCSASALRLCFRRVWCLPLFPSQQAAQGGEGRRHRSSSSYSGSKGSGMHCPSSSSSSLLRQVMVLLCATVSQSLYASRSRGSWGGR